MCIIPYPVSTLILMEVQMGCVTKFLLTAATLWGFSYLGWISFAEGAIFWNVVLVAFLVMLLMDGLFLLPKFIVQIMSLPASCMTAGVAIWVIEGVFKYLGLLIAAELSHLFFVPWIFGAFWWQALIIVSTFGLIAYIMRTKVTYVTSYSSSSSK